VAAYDVAAFGDLAQLKANMDGMLKGLRETKPMPGHDRVYYAGLPEHETAIKRGQEGVPLHPEVIEWFKGVCAEFEIPFVLA
jgi:LDH2 family malate/lactate/ureidoglycolate dehydrogenase